MGILDSFKITGRSAYVTGGSMGIGKVVAMGLAEAGANVAIVGRNLEPARAVAKEIADRTGVKTIAVRADVSKPEDCERFVDETVKAFGGLDIGVNNAGIVTVTPAEEMGFDEWRQIIDTNLSGVYFCCRAAGRWMMGNKKKGVLVNTASMSGHIVNLPQTLAHYTSSKAGVIHLTKTLAVEWAKYGIRVNCVSPGYIGTDLVKSLTDLLPHWLARTPMGRVGTPEDLRGAFLYLASDASAFATGTDLVVDGGYTCV